MHACDGQPEAEDLRGVAQRCNVRQALSGLLTAGGLMLAGMLCAAFLVKVGITLWRWATN